MIIEVEGDILLSDAKAIAHGVAAASIRATTPMLFILIFIPIPPE